MENPAEPNADIIGHLVRRCRLIGCLPRSLTNYCVIHCDPFPARTKGCKWCYAILESEYLAAEVELMRLAHEDTVKTPGISLDTTRTDEQRRAEAEERRYRRLG